MIDYTAVVNQIDSATSIAQISSVVSNYSSSAVGPRGTFIGTTSEWRGRTAGQPVA